MSRASRLAGAVTAIAAALVLPATASAHGIVGKEDLPIPKWLFAWAATGVLVASFTGLAALWGKPRLQEIVERRRFGVPHAAEVLTGLIGVAAFAICVYAGFAGVQVDTANLLPTVVYVVFWVGIPIASMLAGDIFRAFSPWRAVGRASGWAARRLAGESLPAPLAYPERLGRWPAVAGVLAFAWVELVYTQHSDPSKLAIMALVYSAIQLIGMSLYGERAWTANGDAFGGVFALFGKISPLSWRDGALYTRPVLGGLPSMAVGAGSVALLCTMIGTTSFDGFSQGSIWVDLVPHLQRGFTGLGFSENFGLQGAGTIGLVVMVLLVNGLYKLGIDGMRSVGGGHTAPELAQKFAHTLAPIAVAYMIAHYFSLLAYQGQAVAYLASDPLGHGSDIFGTAGSAINYTWIGATGIWYVQLGALLGGHIAGLILAHDRALALYPDPRAATRSQYWMLAVMVTFTSLGLWLLSAAAQ